MRKHTREDWRKYFEALCLIVAVGLVFGAWVLYCSPKIVRIYVEQTETGKPVRVRIYGWPARVIEYIPKEQR